MSSGRGFLQTILLVLVLLVTGCSTSPSYVVVEGGEQAKKVGPEVGEPITQPKEKATLKKELEMKPKQEEQEGKEASPSSLPESTPVAQASKTLPSGEGDKIAQSQELAEEQADHSDIKLEYDGKAFSRQIDKLQDELKPKRKYSILLEDPDKLGFEPTDTLFRNVYYHVKRDHVAGVSDDDLVNGLVAEVRNLIDQAELSTEVLDNLDLNKRVIRQILKGYDGQIDRNLLLYASILGMLDALDDPYTNLMTPDEFGDLEEQMQSKEFGGIGVYIELDRSAQDQLMVFEPIEGTPAYEAGLLPGDRIYKIDGLATKGMTLDIAQSKIRGPVGSAVVLTIVREGREKPFDITVVRNSIHVVSITSKVIDGFGYIRCRSFGSQTSNELAEAILKLRKKKVKGIILDLRNNGGGYINASVEMVGQLLEKPRSLVVYTVDKEKKREEYRTWTQGSLEIPLVVMINRFSASASEITAGALKDHGVATLVGEHSFGKGSVQQLFPFNDGCALKLTIAKFFTPNGDVIDKEGIQPDIELEMSPALVGRKGDIQLEEALNILKKQQR